MYKATINLFNSVQFSSFQSLSHVWFFATPWTTACQASLSISPTPITQTHVYWVSDAANHLILCRPCLVLPLIFPSIRIFSNWVSFSHQVAKVLEFQLQHQSWTALISLQSKGLSRVFSNTIVQKHQFFGAQLSL